MTYTKKEREQYNMHRESACARLGITKNQYNWFRREGEKLRSLYVQRCNGTIDESVYNNSANLIESYILEKAKFIKLFVYLQTDPRGATIYLDKVSIPDNNYTKAGCIY